MNMYIIVIQVKKVNIEFIPKHLITLLVEIP